MHVEYRDFILLSMLQLNCLKKVICKIDFSVRAQETFDNCKLTLKLFLRSIYQ